MNPIARNYSPFSSQGFLLSSSPKTIDSKPKFEHQTTLTTHIANSNFESFETAIKEKSPSDYSDNASLVSFAIHRFCKLSSEDFEEQSYPLTKIIHLLLSIRPHVFSIDWDRLKKKNKDRCKQLEDDLLFLKERVVLEKQYKELKKNKTPIFETLTLDPKLVAYVLSKEPNHINELFFPINEKEKGSILHFYIHNLNIKKLKKALFLGVDTSIPSSYPPALFALKYYIKLAEADFSDPRLRVLEKIMNLLNSVSSPLSTEIPQECSSGKNTLEQTNSIESPALISNEGEKMASAFTLFRRPDSSNNR